MIETIGRYRIEKKLGEGGVGEVFQAVDPVLGRPVAIKRLRPELARREQIVARFKSEARTLAQLNHPNIATLYSFERDADSLLMVMEYVEGETLSTLLRRDGAFPLERALPLIVQALDGLGYAHERGVIHRDIKGPNLMLRSDGVLKVMDFGIARVIGSERVTQLGQLVGTPEFMSPEQIRGHETDVRSDIYSLGILCYALLVGRVPFASQSGFDVMKAQIETPPLPASQAAPHPVPEALDAVIGRALAKCPTDRYASTEEFRSCIEPFLSRRSNERRREGDAPGRIAIPSGATADPANPDEATEDMPVPTDRPTCILADEDAPTRPSASRASETQDSAPATRVEAADCGPVDAAGPDATTEGAAAIAVAADVAREAAPPMSRLQQAAWVLAPSLLAILWMGVSALWTELAAEPARSHATAAHETRPVEETPTPAAATEATVALSPAAPQPTESGDPPASAVAVVEPSPAAVGEDASQAGSRAQAGDEAAPTARATTPKPAAMAAAPPARRAQPPRRARPSARTAAPPARPAPRPETTKTSPAEEEKGWVIRRR